MDGHGVSGGDSVEEEDEEFADAVHEVHVLVGAGLVEEGFDIAFSRKTVGAGGEVEHGFGGVVEVLGAEEAGAVAGDFGLAEPFVEGGDDGDGGGIAEADEAATNEIHEGEEDSGDGHIEEVPGFDVSEFVADEIVETFVIEGVDDGTADDDVGAFDASGEGVGEGVAGNVEFRFGHIEDLGGLLEDGVEASVLLWSAPDGHGHVADVHPTVDPGFVEFGDKLGEEGDFFEPFERFAVGFGHEGVGADAREAFSGHIVPSLRRKRDQVPSK